MKTSIRPRTRITAILGLTLLTSFTLSTVVFAAKGGGKGKPGDGGGEDPPPVGEVPPVVAAPITYEAQFFGLADVAETAVPWAAGTEVDFYFDDINRDGVAVGQAWTGPFPGTGYAIMATAAGGIRFLDTVFEGALTTDFAGFRIVGAWKINASGQVACSLADATEVDRWVAVGDLNDGTLMMIDGPLVKTSGIYPVSDLNEEGDVITSEVISVTRKRKTTRTGVHRFHMATADVNGQPAYAIPVVLSHITALSGPTLNTTQLQVAYGSTDGGHISDLTGELDTTIPGTVAPRIADDGSGYTFVTTATSPETQGYPARWTEGGGLQPLAELQVSSPKLAVVDVSEALGSESIEVIMARGAIDSSAQTELEIYRAGSGGDILGSRYAVSITDGEVITWETNIRKVSAVSRPNGSGHGFLCGQAWYDSPRMGFILTPVAP